MKTKEFTPILFSLAKEGINKHQISKDILSGIIVGIIALPLAIAFSIASGVSPDKGLITAIIAGLIISTFGGSRVQIAGPTGAFIVIIYSIVQEHGVEGLTIATFMAGFIIIALGLAKLGNYLKFIPYPLVVGFTSGIAVIIFSTQIKDFLGLNIATTPPDFIDKWVVYFEEIKSANLYSVLIAFFTVIITLNFFRVSKKIPGSLVAIILSTLFVYFFNIPVDTIESKFGNIPNTISLPQFPIINFEIIQQLIQPAIAIALLGAIESLLSAVVADGMVGGRHRSNMELIAQGAGNIAASLFGGIPATGAIARTATNVKNGARTPISGIVHSITLLLIMLLFAPVAKLIPLACLAGILMVVAYHMSEWRHFIQLLKSNYLDVLVLLTTFFLTIFFDLIIAIQVGMILSSFIFMKRMSESTTFTNATHLFDDAEPSSAKLFEEELPKISDKIMLYEINGPLFFGASQKFQEFLSDLNQQPDILIIRMRNVPFIDATGINSMTNFIHAIKDKGTKIIISGTNEQLKSELRKSNIDALIGTDRLFDNINDALRHANSLTH